MFQYGFYKTKKIDGVKKERSKKPDSIKLTRCDWIKGMVDGVDLMTNEKKELIDKSLEALIVASGWAAMMQKRRRKALFSSCVECKARNRWRTGSPSQKASSASSAL